LVHCSFVIHHRCLANILTLFSSFFLDSSLHHPNLLSFPTRRSSDLPHDCSAVYGDLRCRDVSSRCVLPCIRRGRLGSNSREHTRSEEHTSELQSRFDLVCRLLLEKKKKDTSRYSASITVSRL